MRVRGLGTMTKFAPAPGQCVAHLIRAKEVTVENVGTCLGFALCWSSHIMRASWGDALDAR